MAEYIERASLVGALINSNAQAMIRAMTGEEAYSYFLRLVNTAPTADVAPVRRGYWRYGVRGAVCSVRGFERHLDDDFGGAIACPNCGVACPNCGAKTDGGNDDDRGSHGERSDGEAVLGV